CSLIVSNCTPRRHERSDASNSVDGAKRNYVCHSENVILKSLSRSSASIIFIKS
ncbi:unnamed protein product, partial [Adineta steineri]